MKGQMLIQDMYPSRHLVDGWMHLGSNQNDQMSYDKALRSEDQEKGGGGILVEIEEERTKKQTGPQFIPKLRGKKVIIRLVTGGQPITGILEGYNAYEILIKTAKGEILVFKHAIAIIEPVDMPKQQIFTLKE